MQGSESYIRLRGLATPIVRPGSRLLIVEDDTAFSELLRRSLIVSGYDVAMAATVSEARSRLREEGTVPFDLVVADIRLPHQSGIELVFPDDRTKLRPAVLMMTAFASRELKTFLDGLGVALIEKPFSLDALHARVMDLLLKRQLHGLFGPLKTVMGQGRVRRTTG